LIAKAGRGRSSKPRGGECRVIEKLTYCPRECVRLLIVEIVSTAREWPEHDAFDGLGERRAVRDRDDVVAISPADGDGREHGELLGALEERATLATPVDDVPHGSGECARRPARAVDGAELRDLVRGEPCSRKPQGDPSSKTHEALPE